METGIINILKTLGEGQSCVTTLLFGEVCDSCDAGASLKVAAEIIKILSVGVGIVGIIGIMVVGIKYLTSGGDAAKAVKTRKRLIEIIIGLASYAVLFWFANFLLPGGIIASTLDSTTTSCPEASTTDIVVKRPIETELDTGRSGGGSGGDDGGSSTALLSGTATTYTYKGEKYLIANTKNSLDTYIGIINKYRVAQDQYGCKIINNAPSCTDYGSYRASRDSDTCLSFAQTFVHDMYFGTYTSDWCASQYVRSGWDDIQNDSLQAVLKRAYQEINSGRPVVILVHYNSSSSRHFVAMVGYRASVKSGDSITKDDLLLLNTKNGLTRAGGGTLEVIKDTHSPHKYRIFVLKNSVLRDTRKNILTCSK